MHFYTFNQALYLETQWNENLPTTYHSWSNPFVARNKKYKAIEISTPETFLSFTIPLNLMTLKNEKKLNNETKSTFLSSQWLF